MIIISLLAAGIIMLHVINLVSKFNHETWLGHKAQFAALAAAYACLAGGAVGAAVGYPHADLLLAIGVSGILLFDRRIRA
jgi:hypothetical protein